MITIDEAIKLIQDDIDHNYYVEDSPLEKAVKLSIEALKRCQAYKKAHIAGLSYKPMEGETEE